MQSVWKVYPMPHRSDQTNDAIFNQIDRDQSRPSVSWFLYACFTNALTVSSDLFSLLSFWLNLTYNSPKYLE